MFQWRFGDLEIWEGRKLMENIEDYLSIGFTPNSTHKRRRELEEDPKLDLFVYSSTSLSRERYKVLVEVRHL